MVRHTAGLLPVPGSAGPPMPFLKLEPKKSRNILKIFCGRSDRRLLIRRAAGKFSLREFIPDLPSPQAI